MSASQSWPQGLLVGKTAFITGGGSGINLGIAHGFAALGAKIAICGRTEVKLAEAAKSLRAHGGNVFYRVADVREPEQLEAAINACGDELGPIDILVCGAAGNFLVPTEQLSPNGFKSVVAIDLLGSFNASRLAFGQLKRTRGSIIFISAGMAHVPHAFQAHVGAAKAGVDQLMKCLALEWGGYGVRANSIVPGPIGGTEGMRRLASAATMDELTGSIPLRRIGTVDDIAAAAIFLASPWASYVTGTIIAVDGGQSLVGSAPFNQGAARILAQANRT
ncbi:MAG TPA: SDR family oxidoreductase [Steroidobacteraceae bacterium]